MAKLPRNQLKAPPKKLSLPAMKEKTPTKAAVKSKARAGQLPPPPKVITLDGSPVKKAGINPKKK
jgi:hypothetical protein